MQITTVVDNTGNHGNYERALKIPVIITTDLLVAEPDDLTPLMPKSATVHDPEPAHPIPSLTNRIFLISSVILSHHLLWFSQRNFPTKILYAFLVSPSQQRNLTLWWPVTTRDLHKALHEMPFNKL
jgi:hypothetical protein